jgi:ubiquitin-like-conjugating enzyme ATG3
MNYLHSLREYVTPVLQTSNFKKQGVLTPKEFIEAGDFLVYKCPTWEWSGGVSQKRRSYFPDANKQYLVTRNVPCSVRCDSIEYKPSSEEGGWTIYEDAVKKPVEVPIDIDVNDSPCTQEEKNEEKEQEQEQKENRKNDEEEEDTFVFAEEEQSDMEDIAVYKDEEEGNILKTRTYDLYITYDNYYRTPRVWLFGYNENGKHLTEDEMFQDISSTHAGKTVTYEMHPHEKYMALSIHPCRHASTMKKLISRQPHGEKLRPDQYLCMFLKFIGTVIPTISYDYSMSI